MELKPIRNKKEHQAAAAGECAAGNVQRRNRQIIVAEIKGAAAVQREIAQRREDGAILECRAAGGDVDGGEVGKTGQLSARTGE